MPGCRKPAPSLRNHVVALGDPTGMPCRRSASPDRRTEIPYLARLYGWLGVRLRPWLDGIVAGAGRQGGQWQPTELPVQAGLHLSRCVIDGVSGLARTASSFFTAPPNMACA